MLADRCPPGMGRKIDFPDPTPGSPGGTSIAGISEIWADGKIWLPMGEIKSAKIKSGQSGCRVGGGGTDGARCRPARHSRFRNSRRGTCGAWLVASSAGSLSENQEGVPSMGLARRAQGAMRRRCRCPSLTTSNAAIAAQPPCALRVPAAREHLRRWCSSTMYTDIACVAPSCICPRGARNAAPLILGQTPSGLQRRFSIWRGPFRSQDRSLFPCLP